MESGTDYLNEFVYDTKLKDLGVFSKQYFNSILYSMYKEIPEENLLCFTFGDFNKLNQINKNYSYEIGDSALATSLQLIKDTLPENTIIARIAGDEFCFLNPDVHKKDMDTAFKKVNTILEENKDKNYGLTITTSSMDSTLYPDFDELYAHTELDVNRKKKTNHKKQFKNTDELLSDSIYNGLNNYFSYYRLESSALPKEYYSILKNSIINLVIHNLEKPNENMSLYFESLKESPPDTDFESKHFEVKQEVATRNSQLYNKW